MSIHDEYLIQKEYECGLFILEDKTFGTKKKFVLELKALIMFEKFRLFICTQW